MNRNRHGAPRSAIFAAVLAAAALLALAGCSKHQRREHAKAPAAARHEQTTTTTAYVPPMPVLRGDVFDTLQENAWYLPVGGKVQLYVTALGKGPDVVVLHGGPGNDFNYLVKALRPLRDDFRFILFDQRGSLLSPVPTGGISDLSFDDLVSDLETLRKALGEQRMVLLGHSFGSLLALAYYRKHPGHVAGMVLISAVPPTTPAEGGFKKVLADIRDREQTLKNRAAVTAVRKAAGLPTGPDADKTALDPQRDTERWKIGAAAVNLWHVERWREFQGGGVYYNARVDNAIGDTIPGQWDVRPTLHAHPVPVTVIQGRHDYLDPLATGWHAVAKSDRNVRVNVLPDAGHYAWIDAPRQFSADLADGLHRAVSAPPPPATAHGAR